MQRESFVFYGSFLKAIKVIKKRDIQAELALAIIEYGLTGEVTECGEMVEMAMELIKPQIDANNQKFMNGNKGAEFGKLGGAPKGNQNAKKTTPKQPQNNPKTTPNVDVDVDVDVDVECKYEDVNEKENVNYNNLKIFLLSQHSKIDLLGMKCKVSAEMVKDKIAEFIVDKEISGDSWNSNEDCWKNFTNWLPINLKKTAEFEPGNRTRTVF